MTVKENSVIFYNINIFLLVDKFTKEFINYYCILLINFFSRYNQIFLYKKNRVFIIFIILLKII